MSSYLADDRAVATTLGYTLALTIATLLVTGLLVASGGLVEDQREQSIRSELRVVGQQVVGDVQSADRLALREGSVTRLEVRGDHPRRVTGVPYRIAVVDSDDPDCAVGTCLELSTTDPQTSVTVRLGTTVPVTGDARGGPLVVRCLDADDDDVCDDDDGDGVPDGLVIDDA